jgi:hypothetical protein
VTRGVLTELFDTVLSFLALALLNLFLAVVEVVFQRCALRRFGAFCKWGERRDIVGE